MFVGLSGANLLEPEDLRRMAPGDRVRLLEPGPGDQPELAHATRNDVIMATGRSDYPNQVNNVLGFPFIFRGALDVRATRINEEMKIAAALALRDGQAAGPGGRLRRLWRGQAGIRPRVHHSGSRWTSA